jgi:prepilin-type N-terminal cleavage/methylation domain-containing protein
MAPNGSPRPNQSGYSLIELLVVLAVVAILVIVGVSTMGSKRKPAVREMTQQLSSSLADAQQLARSTGRQVVLHVKGATPTALTIDFEYQAIDPADATKTILVRGGGFSMAAQGSNSAYAVPGLTRTQTASTGVDITSLKNLGLVTDWDTFFVDSNAVFQGSETQNLTFSSSGQISQDCFATVSSPVAGPGNPIGLVVATRRNGIHAYFFSGETGATWRSL